MGHRGWAAPPLASPANCAMLEGGQDPQEALLAAREGKWPMADDRGVTHYDLMPIPPIEAHTRFFEADPIVIGVEYRLLDEEIAAASEIAAARGSDMGPGAGMDDRGVSLHVYAVEGGERLEHLRFDCFEEDPHYHYVSWKDRTNPKHDDQTTASPPKEDAKLPIKHRPRSLKPSEPVLGGGALEQMQRKNVFHIKQLQTANVPISIGVEVLEHKGGKVGVGLHRTGQALVP